MHLLHLVSSFAAVLQNLRAVTLPRVIDWSQGLGWLAGVFDWDFINIFDEFSATLSFEIALCIGYFPCSIILTGAIEKNSSIKIVETGQISCLKMEGCSQVFVHSVSFICNKLENSTSLFKAQGAEAEFVSSTFVGCWSGTDGGVMQFYNRANVTIRSSEFRDSFSAKSGGAIAALGSNIAIFDSTFVNCTSQNGGGALWFSEYTECYGSLQFPHTSEILIESSFFQNCSTVGSGGAILADTTTQNGGALNVFVISTVFRDSRSSSEGGAIKIFGESLTSQILLSVFTTCRSDSSGGAISGELSSLSLLDCVFSNNSALGLGGGAIHLRGAIFLAYNTSISNSSASNGGGGAIFWQKSIMPAIIGCPKGSKSTTAICGLRGDNSSVDPLECTFGTCVLCGKGYFQSAEDGSTCAVCPPGTYSASSGKIMILSAPMRSEFDSEIAHTDTAWSFLVGWLGG